MKQKALLTLICFLFILASCKKETSLQPPHYSPTPYDLQIPQFFPTILNIPADNPLTVEGVELGRYLFYDERLSGHANPSMQMSCGTCHLQENSFECGVDHPKYTGGFPFGVTGKPTPHVMLPLVNLVWNTSGYFWSGFISADNPESHFRNIEDIVWMTVVADNEMNSDTNKAKAMIQGIPEYTELFRRAFGSEEVTMKNIGRAIAQFVRTLVSANSKFDRYMRGEEQLNPSELNGFVLFTTEEGADCFHCHGSYGNPLFTTNLFYNNGKDSVFTDTFDRYHVTDDLSDLGAYKATTLRNITKTGPYMHDGRFATLDEVLKFYNEELVWSPYIDPLMHHVGDGGTLLTPSELDDLKAFLMTLEDDEFLTNPDFSKPEKFPGQ